MKNLTPDHLEEELGTLIDNVVPTRGYAMTPLVGIGGSAGAIPALQAFLSSLPPRSGIAYAVVLHLAAERESMLAEILQRSTSMRVLQVNEALKVQPDTVYVIPPGKALQSADGYLQLADLDRVPGKRMAVDLFFRGLADTHGPHAGAVVLSGGDGDGAIGIKRIKERGGLTIAQDPAEAEHPGMPAAAIATGMVDWILPVAEIPSRLLDYYGIEKRLRLPPEEGPHPALAAGTAAADEAPLRDVLAFLRARTGRDFSYYKRATIVRRIARRMQVNGVDSLTAYLDCLRTRSGESGALLQDLLISVTNFFRDAECFDALNRHLPALFEGKGPNDAVRVWVAACATGEEAYSIAILLLEHARTLEAPPTLQLFASDLDDRAVQTGREGRYPLAIQADLSPERLRRYFIKEHDGYRVRREVREMVLFASHDLLRDSPFSRLDLISCRNLLIYLDPTAQARVFEVLGFALMPHGRLFLGVSESVEDGNPHFRVLDKKHRIYARRDVPIAGIPLPAGPSSLALAMDVGHALREAPIVAGRVFQQASLGSSRAGADGRSASWGDVHLKLLEHLCAPSLLIDRNDDIVHLSASAGRFLHYGAGEPTRNLLRLALADLRIELRAALHQATRTGLPVESPPTAVTIDGSTRRIAIRVIPVRDGGLDFTLVIFDSPPQPGLDSTAPPPARADADPLVQQLDHELERMRSHLQDTVEQYENSTQELKASNEELQAINEELRSATEELETSREELQSINEELTTVNHELKCKVDELAHANSDMQNLMNATAIATVFLDRDLRITRYTPAAVRLFNLIPGDVGRPLSDLASQLQYPALGDDAAHVLDKLIPIEREVGRDDGSWFMARLLPYRTTEDRIAGVVLSFINITERKQAEQVSQWLSTVVASSVDAIISFSLEGQILSWNSGAQRIFGYAAEEAVGRSITMLAPDGDPLERLGILERVRHNQSVENLETVYVAKDGTRIELSLTVSPIVDARRAVVGATATARDIGEAKRAQEALRRSEEHLRLVVENARDYAIFSTDIHRVITSWNAGAERLLGYSEAEVKGLQADIIFTPEDRAANAPRQEAETATFNERAADERFHQRKDGTRFWGSGVLMRMHDESGRVIGFVKVLQDQTVAREAQAALERSQSNLLEALRQNEHARAELESADAAKDRFIAVLSHELRNPLASMASASDLLAGDQADADERRRAAQVVQRQVRSMKLLVDDLLDVSRLAIGQLELRRLDVTVANLVGAAVETAIPLIEAAGHTLKIELPSTPVHVHVDPLRIGQALVNLLANAARYTPAGGALLLAAQSEADSVRISVVDNGVGMEPETIARIFELYAQGPAATDRANEGLGIGLALVRSIVEQHGGRIEAFSDGLGRGSRFSVTLPLAAPVAEPAQAAKPEPARSPTPLRILVADDNVDAGWTLGRLLQLAGHETMVVSNGTQALETAARQHPDAAILDIGMPDINGVDVARALREQAWAARMALVALSGWGDAATRHDGAQVFDAHLTKPASTAKVLEAVIRAREARARAQED
ncbi:PAS domain S-box protein [Variovorax ginsengisoli]|uniref:PAS domain S-box protein n=1 Tax=Variovorax ginsengisoli TaxID=363844 RepID=A0ABT8S8Y5_9BURK|nr:PAS domain S-box protein [Variovorax ginsengisoli]MDN8616060.1 PAS domain S-box protein [Variovorax ginsengisoli]MDO1535230.1 PAS domain S-box protein [Variovorax ginsengisoli]